MLIGDSLRVMTKDEFTIELSRDQALVLSDWLHRATGTAAFEAWPVERAAGRDSGRE